MPTLLAEKPRTAIAAAIKRATHAAHREVLKLDRETLDDLERIYKQAAQEIANSIALRAGADGNLALAELQSALAQVNAVLANLEQVRNRLLTGALEQVASLGVKPYLGDLAGAAAALTPAAGQAIANNALSFVRTFIAKDGLQLSDRIWRIDRGARDVVANAIEQSVIQGHGAAQAAREFLERGQAVPVEIQAKINAANAAALGKRTTTQLLTGTGSPMDNAMRLFRTEINRAHGEAYMAGGEGVKGFAGWRFLLSPAHPAPDICDLLSQQNLYGLGRGVYPTREKTPWPAHPNTISFVEIVFENEITEADRAGKETPMEAMKRLTPEQQKGVLGAGKFDLLQQGKITQGMIRTPLAKVRERVKVPIEPERPPPLPTPAAKPAKSRKPKAPQSLDDYIAYGATKADELVAAAGQEPLLPVLLADLSRARGLAKAAKLANSGRGAALVKAASQRFPDEWTAAANRLGPLNARLKAGRAYYLGQPDGAGEISARDLTSAVHEYAHRLQDAMHGMDDLFQELHQRRTQGEPIRPLRQLIRGSRYAIQEVAQEDKYLSPYQGRIYSDPRMTYLGRVGALEGMSMAFETVLGDYSHKLQAMVARDREMLNLTIGLLYRYAP